jgi:O-antigen/teichoic acid export membrane protein
MAMVSRRRAATFSLAGASANTLIVTVQAFVLVPLALNKIGAGLYGAWVGSGGILLWLQVLDLGFPNLLIQRVGAAYGRGDARSAGDYFLSGALVIGILSAAIVGVGIGVSHFLPGWLGIEGSDADLLVRAFRLGIWGSALGMVANAFVGLARAVQRTGLVAAGMVAGSLAGFAVTLALLLAGRGLWAFAIGIVIRSALLCVAGLLSAVRGFCGVLGGQGRVRARLVREYLVVSPPSAVGTVGYGALGQGETALVAIFVSTDAALVYSLTRRAADTVNSVVDMIGFSSYGGFSHLVGSEDRERAGSVLRELSSLRLTLAVASGAALLAFNRSLVFLWVGPDYYGGFWLNLLVVFQLAIAGQAFLLNYLYRAAGPVLRGSVALSIESILRYGIATALLVVLGIQWMPAAGIAVGLVFGLLYWRWLAQLLRSSEGNVRINRARLWVSRLLVLSVGVVVGIAVQAASWPALVLMALVGGVIGLLVAWRYDPALSGLGQMAIPRLCGRSRGSETDHDSP